MRLLNVVGARPNLMKIAPLVKEMRRFPDTAQRLLHAAQHYDDNMSQVFFDELGIPRADIYLGVGSASHAEQTARVMVGFERILQEEQPDVVVVVGDVNSTLACAITAAKSWVPLAHVEAGLRSLDRRMPEEINRIVTNALSDLLFTTSRDADENLQREGVPAEKIHFVGNVMIDTLVEHRERARQLGTPARLNLPVGDMRSSPCTAPRMWMIRRSSPASSMPWSRFNATYRCSFPSIRARPNGCATLPSRSAWNRRPVSAWLHHWATWSSST